MSLQVRAFIGCYRDHFGRAMENVRLQRIILFTHSVTFHSPDVLHVTTHIVQVSMRPLFNAYYQEKVNVFRRSETGWQIYLPLAHNGFPSNDSLFLPIIN